MKTRTFFEPSDFSGSGQMVIRNSSSIGSRDLGFATTVAYMVGYVYIQNVQNTALISLADGLTTPYASIEALCAHLNDDVCGYRPMSHTEIVNILGYRGSRFLKTTEETPE